MAHGTDKRTVVETVVHVARGDGRALARHAHLQRARMSHSVGIRRYPSSGQLWACHGRNAAISDCAMRSLYNLKNNKEKGYLHTDLHIGEIVMRTHAGRHVPTESACYVSPPWLAQKAHRKHGENNLNPERHANVQREDGEAEDIALGPV